MPTTHFRCIQHISPCQHIRQYPRATSTHEQEALHLSVNEYKPLRYESRPGDLTVLAAPALSCAKELYEPLFDALYEKTARSDAGPGIRSIWAIDYSNQGASGVMNEEKLGDEPSFFDHARDLLLLTNHFKDEMQQPIVGFGHSLGATVMINLSIMHPRLLTGLIMVEPSLLPSVEGLTYSAVYPLTFRRDTWPSREAAVKDHLKNPLYKNWDSRVVELFRKHGLRDMPTALYPSSSPQLQGNDTVTLTSTKHQDAFSYARAAFPAQRGGDLEPYAPSQIQDPEFRWTRKGAVPFYRPENMMTFAKLPNLRPSCLFIYGGKSHWQTQSGPEGRRIKRELTGSGIGGNGGVADGRVCDVVVSKGNHYVPLEYPEATAEEMVKWLSGEAAKWRELQHQDSQRRESVPHGERSKLSEDWIWWTKKQYGGKKLPAIQKPSSKI